MVPIILYDTVLFWYKTVIYIRQCTFLEFTRHLIRILQILTNLGLTTL